uniref:Alpha/beta hydrolase fold-3 domain-containing protein n=1 Tax=Dendroctonus ponderosae TaxID=77166 RepID=A0AAR5Q3B2_DENPD
MSCDQDFEKLYSPSQWSKRFNSKEVLEKHVQFIEHHSRLVREKIPCHLGNSYGPGPKEKYDIYGTDLNNHAPILIHVHGGYYQEECITHSNNGFIASVLHESGIKTILLGYELSPQRTVSEILERLQIGLRECISYATKLESRALYLSGHSVGAHAIAALLTDLKKSISSAESDLIQGVFLICGLYDMVPITKMSANDLLKLTADTARELSPLYSELDYGSTKIFIVGAENDSPAFVSDSQKFYKKLHLMGAKCFLTIIPDADHFDIIENLYDRNFQLADFMVKAIKK